MGEGAEGIEAGDGAAYRVYRRRWFGLAQLVLLNIIVSWDVSLAGDDFISYRDVRGSLIDWLIDIALLLLIDITLLFKDVPVHHHNTVRRLANK